MARKNDRKSKVVTEIRQGKIRVTTNIKKLNASLYYFGFQSLNG
jgi:hypothetical protein